MKHLKYTITIMLGLLIGISLQAQEVTGNNLNIGSGNTINNNNGNAIGTNNVVANIPDGAGFRVFYYGVGYLNK